MKVVVGLVLWVLVLSLPALSGATCGWVLWEKVEQHQHTADTEEVSTVWELHTASETRDECEHVLTEVWQLKLANVQPRPDRPDIEAVTSTPGFLSITYRGTAPHPAWDTHTYRCFPAPLDPRGPKS
jgi:hypothetical protein